MRALKVIIVLATFFLNVAQAEVAEGIYYIRLANNNIMEAEGGTFRNNGCKIQIWQRVDNVENQKWQFIKLPNGRFKLKNLGAGKVLDAHNIGVNTNQCKVQLWDDIANSANQEWVFQELGGGRVTIRCAASSGNKVLDVTGYAVNVLGTAVQLYDYNSTNTANQIWYLDKIAASSGLKGWVDMHTHPMSYLGFGRKLMHGEPDGNIATALANCNCTHGGWGVDNTCGNYIRAIAVSKAFDKDYIYNVDHNPFEGGNLHGDHRHAGIETTPNFLYWPHQSSKAHQQMWWQWIERAYREGGLRVMVALTVNSELLANVIDGDAPYDDKTTADTQIDALKAFVGRHNNFMEIAYSASDMRRIVGANKLAVIVGMEVDNIGNFHKNGVVCNETTVRGEIRRLYDKGVRYVFPIHLIDNKFGGTAIYEDLFNLANKYATGNLYTVQSASSIDPTISHRLGAGLDGAGNLGIKAALDAASGIPFPPAFNAFSCPIPTLGCWDKFNLIRGLVSPDPRYAQYAAISGGHANAKGLTPMGNIAINELMKLGMLIDIDHMSQKSVDNTLDFAERFNYPVNIGHNGLRGNAGPERAASERTAKRVATLGGIFGIGTADSEEGHNDAVSFISNFNLVATAMRSSPSLPYGTPALAMGTDVDGMERLPRASQGLNSTSFYAGFNKCQTGNRTWDYTTEGVAHYGLMADFMRDIRNRNATVYDNLMRSAEYFALMWEKCERQRSGVR